MRSVSKIEFNDDYSNILNTEIIGYDGNVKRVGIVERVSIQNHSVLGRLVQIWVKWNGQDKPEPFFPRQFEKYLPSNNAIGIYVA